MRFIGDIHGDMDKYLELIKGCENSIQVGDFGAGFVPLPDPANLPLCHKFIRGNHDSPYCCRLSSHWIKDGTWDELHKMMFIGGAYSIDQNWRTPMISWWPDEELSYEELSGLISEYDFRKPEVMVTHDCPDSIRQHFFRIHESTKTSAALQSMFEIHKPKLWIFGHHHRFKNEIIKGTRFICLGIDETCDIDIKEKI